MNTPILKSTLALAITISGLFSTAARADWDLVFSKDDFAVTDVYNDIVAFDFRIQIAGDLTPGVYDSSNIVAVDLTVEGSLPDPTPSGFSTFRLNRPQSPGSSITGAEFIAQGSSLDFEIAATADLSDGLQFNELVGGTNAFVFNGREVDTGRYHPPVIELSSDGTGLLENSNNSGGINPLTLLEVNVNRGDEYRSTLAFDPATLTLSPPPSVLLGDVNRDGTVDFFDISAFIDALNDEIFQIEADTNTDGIVDFSDISAFIAILFG